MIERETFLIQHGDGTTTILGAKEQSFSVFRSPHQLTSETDIENKIKHVPLPFIDKPETVIGWGGFSVAARLENSSPDSSRKVVVFRELPTKTKDTLDPLKEVALRWREEQDVNEQFVPFTIPQSLVIVNGIDGKPMAVKVATEVEGATFKNLSLLSVLGNHSVLEQYINFCQKALKIFISEGKLIDTSGHFTRDKLRQLWIGMIPFYSDNLMVEYGSNKVIFVDCDVKPSIHFFQKADWPQKSGMLMRAGFIGTTAVAAKAFTLAHHARNRFFEENYTKIKRDRISNSEEYQNFVEGLREIVQSLDDAGINYRVIGSIGMAAAIQSADGEFYLTPKRVNLTQRDVDIIVLERNSEKLENLRKYLRERGKTRKGYPIISLETPITIDGPVQKRAYPHDKILPTEFTRVGIDEESRIYLVYKDLTSEINTHLLEPVIVEYEGIRLPSVAPGVLAGFALTRGGNFKSRDLEKIKSLFDSTKFHIPTEFRDFAQKIRQDYPDTYNNFLFREWLNYWTGGFISGGQITRFIDYIRTLH